MNFGFVVNNSGLSMILNGKDYTLAKDHPNFLKVKELIKERNSLPADEFVTRLEKLVDLVKAVEDFALGKVNVVDGVIHYEGKPVPEALSKRMLQMVRDGLDCEHYVKFIERLKLNPSYRAVNELYTFLEKNDLPITTEGTFLAYKKVRADYKDIYSNTFDNSVGAVLEMPRNEVDDNAHNTCSRGFHFASLSYMPHFGAHDTNEYRIMVLEIDPADVVSIPVDYNHQKGRTWKYKVVDEHSAKVTEIFDKSVYKVSDDGLEPVTGKTASKLVNWLSAEDAADELGITLDALRKRAARGVSVVSKVNANGDTIYHIVG